MIKVSKKDWNNHRFLRKVIPTIMISADVDTPNALPNNEHSLKEIFKHPTKFIRLELDLNSIPSIESDKAVPYE